MKFNQLTVCFNKSATITAVIIFLLYSYSVAQETDKKTAVFNQNWLKTIVSIEISQNNINAPIGTGFLVNTPNSHIALVTAKHVVFESNGNLRQNLAYRLNDTHNKSLLLSDEDITKYLKSGWIPSNKYDIACRLIAIKDTSDIHTIPLSIFLSSNQVQAGAPLFMIGFPLGLRSEDYAIPIVRKAIVARSDTSNIIIDGFAFPGNSGGPVIYEPSIQLGGSFSTPILQGDWFIGMISSYIPYREAAISQQTNRPRIIFEENSGLSNIVPANLILELLQSPEFRKIDIELK